MAVDTTAALLVLAVLCLPGSTEAGLDQGPRLNSPQLQAAAASRYSVDGAPRHSPAVGPHSDLFSLTRQDLAHMKNVFTKIPIQGTPLEVINQIAKRIEEDPGYEWEELAASFAERDPVEVILENPSLEELIKNYRPVTVSSGGFVVANDEDDIPEPEDRQQTQGWEGCLADYDAYIGPFTDKYRYETELKIRDRLGIPGNVDPPLEIPNWSRLLLDSNGKRPTGLSQGRKHWLGAIELCVDIVINHTVSVGGSMENRMFKGKYARLDMPIDLSPLGLNATTSFPFQLGVCVPDTCNAENITYYIMEENQVLSFMFTNDFTPQRNISNVYFGSTADFSTDKPAKAALGIAIGGIIIIIFASCYDGWGRPQIIRKKIKKYVTGSTEGKHDPLTVDELKWSKKYLYESPGIGDKLEVAFGAYSLYTSFTNIFTTRKDHRQFHVPALDGLRVLLIMWIVKGMTYVYGIVYFECWTTDNLITAIQVYTKDWRFMMILSMYHANTGLFFVSGFLCVQMWYKAYYENNNKLGVGICIRYILQRYLNFMPVAMGMLMFYTCFYLYTEGPMNPSYLSDATNCRTTWWTVMVMFHNVVKTDQQCMSWTFMFAAVFQLNIFSLFVILIPLALAPVAAYVLLALMYIAHIVITVIWNQKVMDGELSWYFDIVQTPWCNAGPYCIGMMLAMIMHDHKPNWSTKCKKACIFFLWLFAWAGILICIYMRWDKFKGDAIIENWSRTGEITFDVLSPQIFAFSLAWVVYACHYGYGGIFGSLLNWRAFTPLSRVCLPAVSFMGPTMTGYIYARLQTVYIHENHMGNLYYGHLISVFYFGVFAAIFFHHPIGRSLKKQMSAKTRLELFLHCRHPEILDQFSGLLKDDKHVWEALDEITEDDEKGKTKVGGLGSSVDIMRGRSSIGGYIPHQELDGVPEIKDNYTKVPIVNGVKVIPNNDLPQKGFDNKGFVADRHPPQYEEVDKVRDFVETTVL